MTGKGLEDMVLPHRDWARGFVGTSTTKSLRHLGLVGRGRTNFVRKMSEAAEKTSDWL